MRLSTLIYSAGGVSAAALSVRQEGKMNMAIVEMGHEFIPVPFEEAVAKFADLPNDAPNTTAEDDGFVSTMAACGRPLDVRVEWRRMTAADQRSWLSSVNCLMDAPSRINGESLWEDLAKIHRELLGSIHNVDIFLPWHREFIKIYENLMRNTCGYRGPLPWWDETLDAGRFSSSPLFQATTFGSLPVGQGRACINNGAFAGRIFNVDGAVTCLARQANNAASTGTTVEYIRLCNSNTRFPVVADCNENGPHNAGHNAVGGLMAFSTTAPLDPVFFLHHAFVDRMWKLWQNQDPARVTSISGCVDNSSPCTQPLTRNTVLRFNGLSPDVTISQLLDTANDRMCYRYD